MRAAELTALTVTAVSEGRKATAHPCSPTLPELSTGGARTDTTKGPGRRRETAPGPFGRGRGYYFSFVPVERRFAHASVTRLAMLASASLPQVRGS
ncbi:hypothetical protein OV450_1569 [Actinobacteria bacterium OV450]|nr:hypothetical protein OV450_1569 [Actinobacteria bacterium OV450]